VGEFPRRLPARGGELGQPGVAHRPAADNAGRDLARREIAEAPQQVVELVGRAGAAAELLLDLVQRVAVDQLAELFLAEELLEQVSVEGEPRRLPDPFVVVATQNPIEYEGTYALPEAQLDRFTARLSLGYPPAAEEARMLAEQTTSPPLERLHAVADRDDVLGAIAAARAVYVEESVGLYVVEVLRHTRESSSLALGASPRAGIALLRMAKARAVASGRDYALPEDVQAVAGAVLAHRLILAPEARAAGVTGEDTILEALRETPVPA